ncbi:sigma-70 family RNA polymerase sigma factor [Methylobacterium sp. Leaf118]|uniref:sigma-70 family RNA polymerase sigma factor n=1 Tax=Methylobacterium sp. Leaf118 TaxID=2876562 RepID=UPI001E33ADCC|nr:sigma-70 family RNA polymerase sigma factor [Methylobacterium sp. Leaf118]
MPRRENDRGADPLLVELLRHRPQLVETARRVVRCGARAEDVVQDVCLKVCQNGVAAEVADAAGFLRRMVHNAAIDAVRQTGRECRRSAPEEAGDAVPAPCDCPLRRLEARQTLHRAIAALDEAPARTREAFLSHRIDGVPQKDIAARAGVSPTLVNFMIRDATALCRAAAS